MKRWTEIEVDFLKEFYPIYGQEYCANILNRTIGSIRTKASKLKLKSSLKGKYNLKSTEQYKKELPKDYLVLEEYINSSTKILHQHTICGYKWKVSPNNLTKLVGCPNCSKSGFKASSPTLVYLIYFSALDLYKVGITTNWDKRKYDFGYKPELLFYRKFESGLEAQKLETKWLNNLKNYLYNSEELLNGNTETFIWQN